MTAAGGRTGRKLLVAAAALLLAAVVLLTLLVVYITRLEARIHRGDAAAAAQIQTIGKVTSVCALTAIIFAVLTFD